MDYSVKIKCCFFVLIFSLCLITSSSSAAAQSSPLLYEIPIDEMQNLKKQELPPQYEYSPSYSPYKGVSTDRAYLQGNGFIGIEYTSWIPPDPIIAVGNDYIVVVVNSSFAIFNKNGTKISERTLASFFAPVNPPGDPFDPKIIYDHYNERFVILALSVNSTSCEVDVETCWSSYLLAVSEALLVCNVDNTKWPV